MITSCSYFLCDFIYIQLAFIKKQQYLKYYSFTISKDYIELYYF